jgi:plastocyanin
VRDAVVVAELPGAHSAGVGRGYTVQQKDIAFHPFVLVVPVGATVSFPNGDNTRHHVYSFSSAKRFELKLFARDQTRSVLFDKAGVIALGCNIHDRMTAFIFVTGNAWTAQTDDRGMAFLPDLPNSGGRITIWHPYLRAPGNAVAIPLAAGQRSATAPVRLRPPPMHDMSGY